MHNFTIINYKYFSFGFSQLLLKNSNLKIIKNILKH
jgi:hypothetical protein